MQQARVVRGHEDLGAGAAGVPHLVGPHGHRGLGVLQGEGATEAAALLCRRQLDEAQPSHLLQQLERPVAHPEHPQRVAGRVVGHGVREGRPDVGHAEHVDEELGELVGLRARSGDRVDEGRVTAAPGDEAVLVAHAADARAGGDDDGVVPLEGRGELAHHRDGLVEVAGVDHRLAAAGLAGREVHVDPQPAQQPDDSLAGLGEHGVVDAGEHERDAHSNPLLAPDVVDQRAPNLLAHVLGLLQTRVTSGPRAAVRVTRGHGRERRPGRSGTAAERAGGSHPVAAVVTVPLVAGAGRRSYAAGGPGRRLGHHPGQDGRGLQEDDQAHQHQEAEGPADDLAEDVSLAARHPHGGGGDGEVLRGDHLAQDTT